MLGKTNKILKSAVVTVVVKLQKSILGGGGINKKRGDFQKLITARIVGNAATCHSCLKFFFKFLVTQN